MSEKGVDKDYWFLRCSGLDYKTTLRMLAIAYKEVEK